MSKAMSPIDELCVNTIRILSVDAIQKANSGHPGLPMGAAPMAYALWDRHMVYAPSQTDWPNRDRFVLSGGHGSALLYSLLHLTGFDVTLDDLKQFRQWGGKTPGHPEFGVTPGVEATTGPLGQGAANAVGMAIAERALGARYNREGYPLFDHFTYALVTDGDIMEGLVKEAMSLAGHLKLGKLIYLYDSNDVSLDGPLNLAFSEDVATLCGALGWHVQTVEDGDHDVDSVDAALTAAKAETERPSIIIVKTTIGFGSPNRGGLSKAHGAPLGEEEIALTKEALGWTVSTPFHVPAEASEHLRRAVGRGEEKVGAWNRLHESYGRRFPAEAAELKHALEGTLPEGFASSIPRYEVGQKVATRKAGGMFINAVLKDLPWFIGGDADLSSSCQNTIKDGGSFGPENWGGRNIHFGVREHAMAAIANGMCYHGGVRPFVATFFTFSDYMRPSIRLAAMNHLPVVYVWTHDSIGVGEDGPTHQPVEHLMALRTMPNLDVFRPGDPNEVNACWEAAALSTDRPSAMVLTRQGLPVLEGTLEAAGDVAKGGYVLRDAADGHPEVILLATGSELALAVEAHDMLVAEGVSVRVVSMPCLERFNRQTPDYRRAVLPPDVKLRVSIEAGSTWGWKEFVGDNGVSIGLDRFGASSPAERLFEEFGFTPERVARVVRDLLS